MSGVPCSLQRCLRVGEVALNLASVILRAERLKKLLQSGGLGDEATYRLVRLLSGGAARRARLGQHTSRGSEPLRQAPVYGGQRLISCSYLAQRETYERNLSSASAFFCS